MRQVELKKQTQKPYRPSPEYPAFQYFSYTTLTLTSARTLTGVEKGGEEAKRSETGGDVGPR